MSNPFTLTRISWNVERFSCMLRNVVGGKEEIIRTEPINLGPSLASLRLLDYHLHDGGKKTQDHSRCPSVLKSWWCGQNLPLPWSKGISLCRSKIVLCYRVLMLGIHHMWQKNGFSCQLLWRGRPEATSEHFCILEEVNILSFSSLTIQKAGYNS